LNLDDRLDLLSLFSVIFVLEEKHVCCFNIEVKSILEFFNLLRGLFLQLCKLSFALFNDGIDIHQPIITQYLLLLLQYLCSAVN
jgi:hypothetical protein